jgi:hypothetical protein
MNENWRNLHREVERKIPSPKPFNMAGSSHDKTENGPEYLIPRWQHRLRLVVAFETPKSPCRLAEEDANVVTDAVTLAETAMEKPTTPNLLGERWQHQKPSTEKVGMGRSNPKLKTQTNTTTKERGPHSLSPQAAARMPEAKRERGPNRRWRRRRLALGQGVAAAWVWQSESRVITLCFFT